MDILPFGFSFLSEQHPILFLLLGNHSFVSLGSRQDPTSQYRRGHFLCWPKAVVWPGLSSSCPLPGSEFGASGTKTQSSQRLFTAAAGLTDCKGRSRTHSTTVAAAPKPHSTGDKTSLGPWFLSLFRACVSSHLPITLFCLNQSTVAGN